MKLLVKKHSNNDDRCQKYRAVSGGQIINKKGNGTMTRKLTLGFKKNTCQYCKSCDTKAMRQGRPFCDSEYRPRNDYCENFGSLKPKTK